jgi:hypothetical protein
MFHLQTLRSIVFSCWPKGTKCTSDRNPYHSYAFLNVLRFRSLSCRFRRLVRGRRRAEVARAIGVSVRKSMTSFAPPAVLALACAATAAVCIGVGIKYAGAQSVHIEETVAERGPSSELELTPAQRNAIYQEVHKGLSKVAPSRFPTDVGAEVPPVIDLYTLPDDIVATNPEALPYKFTEVNDQVVLVDPTKMRVIAVIGPKDRD